MIVSFLSGKGGTGKTTLCINIADAVARRGKAVVLIDADPQGSARDWATVRRGRSLFPTIALPLPMVHVEIAKFRRGIGIDFIAIDSPPRVAEQVRSILIASDLVVMPVSPSAFDVWAVQKTINQIESIKRFRESLQAVFVVNRRIEKSTIGRAVVETLKRFDLPIFSTVISENVIFPEAAATGRTIYEVNPRSPAVAEIQALTDEILAYGGIKATPLPAAKPAIIEEIQFHPDAETEGTRVAT